MAKTANNLETSLEELGGIIQQLEGQELGLEESFQLYQEGMKLLKVCNDSIDKVEKKIMVLKEKDNLEP